MLSLYLTLTRPLQVMLSLYLTLTRPLQVMLSLYLTLNRPLQVMLSLYLTLNRPLQVMLSLYLTLIVIIPNERSAVICLLWGIFCGDFCCCFFVFFETAIFNELGCSSVRKHGGPRIDLRLTLVPTTIP